MKSNMLLVGLDYGFTKCVANELSGIFDMRYLDVKDLIAYSFVNADDVLEKLGIEYYNNQVHKIILSTAEYENTIINIPYDLFLSDNICETLATSCLTIFVDLDKQSIIANDKNNDESHKNTVATIAYEEFCELLKQKTDICVTCDDNAKNATEKIIEQLKNL